jgi:hypothetical protein
MLRRFWEDGKALPLSQHLTSPSPMVVEGYLSYENVACVFRDSFHVDLPPAQHHQEDQAGKDFCYRYVFWPFASTLSKIVLNCICVANPTSAHKHLLIYSEVATSAKALSDHIYDAEDSENKLKKAGIAASVTVLTAGAVALGAITSMRLPVVLGRPRKK